MVQLAAHTTLRLGGVATDFQEASTDSELIDLVSTADQAKLPVLVLGGGSNLVVPDSGFAGRVVAVRTAGIEVSADACSGATVTVAAGINWDDFVATSIENGWIGIEALAGIPGTVGATPIQNVGAYGQEVADTIAAVICWDRKTQAQRRFAVADCEFGYRSSRFKTEKDRYLILQVIFQFKLGELSSPVRYAELANALGVPLGDRVTTAALRTEVLRLRAAKGMVLNPDDHDTWSAGSFFTNPIVPMDLVPDGAPSWSQPESGMVKVSAAWLIENAGFSKGYGSKTGISISSKHTLALTNRGSGTTNELLVLATEIQTGVKAKFGIALHPEPNFV